MIQKTLITNNTEELLEYIRDVQNLPEARSEGDKLLLFSEQDGDPARLRDRIARIRRAMPSLKIVGITATQGGFARSGRSGFVCGVHSVFLMERARADLLYYDCRTLTMREAGRQFSQALRAREHVAGALVFSAGVTQEIAEFLVTVAGENGSEVPILGAQAGGETPYLCGSFQDGEPCDCGIAVLILYGRGLNLYYNYDMGWNPIGKEMEITGTDGPYRVTSIDHIPAVEIYRKYLGVEPDDFFSENVREFPFITYRKDRLVVRTPSGYNEDGSLEFTAVVGKGDAVKLSYGSPRRLIEQTRLYAGSMRDFGPQALVLIICENRVRFLGEKAITDIAAYQMFVPQTAWMWGFTAIMLDEKGGGVVNSSIVSLGMREGAVSGAEEPLPVVISSERLGKKGAVPLEQRLAMFLEKTTKELEDMAVAANAANAAKSEFLSMMSHEIRTPINAILGMNEMILRESGSESVLTYAENARAAGLSLLGIINEILDFSKIEAGKMDIVPQRYALVSLISDLVNLIRLRVEERGLTLRVTADPATPHLLIGDELRVKQIITNLLTNAVKYTEKGSVTFAVTFRKTAADEVALGISVEDTGTGIKEENLHKLFNAFDRIDAESTRKIEGTGLGLNITQQLLRLMGSHLEVKSDYGKGSVFSFSLRQKVADWEGIGEISAALRQTDARRARKKESFTAPGARILVVDDAPMNLAVISGLLKRTKIQVDTADSGEECLERFGKNDYDLVFLDHRMPKMDGIETLGRLKELYGEKAARVPVISLTANAMAGARDKYVAMGFSDYLSKPVMADELEAMLLRWLPREKVIYAVSNDAAETTSLPSWLSEVPLLHPDQGVKFCGGVREYLHALALFAASVRPRAEEIEELYRSEDWENYTTKVHGLKSMARFIGAGELADLAAELEAAGNAGDRSAIEAGTKTLLGLYRSLEAPLSRLQKQPAKTPPEQSGNVVTSRRRTILLVDDDEDFLALVSRWLRKDYAVAAVNSGRKALAWLEKERPDLLLLDYEMPEMDGVEVLQRIRENPATEDLAVVFLTGTSDPEKVKAAERLKPEGFLLKTMGKSGLCMGVAAFFD